MHDQSFSNTNFNKIFLEENRKGNFIKNHLNREYFKKHEEFLFILQRKLNFKRRFANPTKSQLKFFEEKLEKINEEKEEIRLSAFKKYEFAIAKKNFSFNICYDADTELFYVNKSIPAFYALKQLQLNLKDSFKVKQANRTQVIKQLYNVISDGFPKIILKTDIKNFYESIPQEHLMPIIENNTRLSPFSKRLIKRVFFEFESTKDTTLITPRNGIPRGIGISSYLSELFMSHIDQEIKCLPDIIFFERYVDDIIIVFVPKTPSASHDYLSLVRNIIQQNLLSLKDGSDGGQNKTLTLELLNKTQSIPNPIDFTYLGYKFVIHQTWNTNNKYKGTKVTIELSDNKINRYIERIRKSVEDYNKNSKFREKLARKLLFDRLRFLSGNYHLNNNKRIIKSGMFYSNSLLLLNNDINSIISLQKIQQGFENEISNILPYSKLGIIPQVVIDHIKLKLNFIEGFKNKENHFYSFRMSQSEQIYYGTKKSKFTIIKSIW